MPIVKTHLIAAVVSLMLHGCGTGPGDEPVDPLNVRIDFNDSPRVWTAGYSDYTQGTEPHEFVAELRALPAPFTGNGFYTLGHNRSDDLFVYIKSKLTGFLPNTRYSLAFSVSFLTNVPTGCAGVGGSPDSVTVKAGASLVEPSTVLIGGYYQMNIDKGNQITGGQDALALGTIGNSSMNCVDIGYESKTLASSSTLELTTDTSGDLWLLAGTDSGFESSSHIYYQTITVTASRL